MPNFTHNGQPATLDLNQFETAEARAQREATYAETINQAMREVHSAGLYEPEDGPYPDTVKMADNHLATLSKLQGTDAERTMADVINQGRDMVSSYAEQIDRSATEYQKVVLAAAKAAELNEERSTFAAETDQLDAEWDSPEAVASTAGVDSEVEQDPFGAALDAPQSAPIAAVPEVEQDPFGAEVDAPQASTAPAAQIEAAPSPVTDMEGVEVNSIAPVKIREAMNDPRSPLEPANAPSMGREEIVIDAQTRNNLARARQADRQAVEEQLGHNESKLRSPAPTESRAQSLEIDRPARDNQVESDEILTASKETKKPILPPDVQRDYVNVGNKYYNQKSPNVVAFEDKGNKLETRSDNEEVAENLVKIAEARGWDEIKVTGTEKFRKEVWLEAAVRGMDVKGYTPSEADKAALAARSKNIGSNSIQNTKQAEQKPSIERERAESFKNDSKETALKKHPELAGAYAARAAAHKKIDADNLSPDAKQHIRNRVDQNITNSIEKGTIPQVQKREDKSAQRGRAAEQELTH